SAERRAVPLLCVVRLGDRLSAQGIRSGVEERSAERVVRRALQASTSAAKTAERAARPAESTTTTESARPAATSTARSADTTLTGIPESALAPESIEAVRSALASPAAANERRFLQLPFVARGSD